MFDRFSRAWALTRASWAVLKQDQQLMVYPLVAGAASVVVSLAFLLGGLGFTSIDGLRHGERLGNGAYLYAFTFYVVAYFLMFFCNAALVGAALIRFDGGTPTVADGWRCASRRAGAIFGYAVIAATVGMVLRAIQERIGFIGRFIVGLLGVGWTFATFLVVPVLVSRDIGPIKAVEESAGLVKATWGENLAGRAGMSLVFVLMHVAVALVGAAAIVAAVTTLGVGPVAILAIVTLVVAELLVGLVHATLTGIYAAALYRFASQGSTGAGFDATALQAAFVRK